MADEKKPNIFQKVLAATDVWLDSQIQKGRNDVQAEIEEENDLVYRKSISKDSSFFLGTQGYQERPVRVTYEHLKLMSMQDSIVAAIIQTRQNQVSGFSKLVRTPHERGFRISLKDERRLLEEIKEELREKKSAQGEPPEEIPGEDEVNGLLDQEAGGDQSPENAPEENAEPSEENEGIQKAEIAEESDEIPTPKSKAEDFNDSITEADSEGNDDEESEEESLEPGEDPDEKAEEEELDEWRIEREAKKILAQRYNDRRRKLEQLILNCGDTKNRPFESKRWNFDSILRAWIRDSLTYDQFGVELVPTQADKTHHFVPVDGATIRFSSPELGKYKTYPLNSNYDLIYPERELDALKETDALELDPKLLEADAYKWVQVIRGRIERAFTESELKVGMRNPTTDVFSNGYPVCELELLVKLLTSHINTEYYNMAYFSQGFSAKGILHLKAPLNRRKIETIRQEWQHMIKGARNSFQTPIFAGMDEVKWIPLTQNHSDIEFQGWLQYLIKMTCFTPDTLVNMADGSKKRMDQIAPGDLVETHTGSFEVVENVQIKKFEGELLKIEAANKEIRTTSEHPFLTVDSWIDGHMVRRFSPPAWKKANELNAESSFLVIPRPQRQGETYTRIDLAEHVDNLLIEGDRITLNSNRSKTVPRFIELTEKNAFVLGLYVAEGHSTNYWSAFAFHAKERELRDAVVDFANAHGLASWDATQSPNSLVVKVGSGVFARAFKSLFGVNSLTRKIPKEIMMSCQEVQRAFISGLLTGDGSAFKSCRSFSISLSTASETLKEQFTHLLLMNGILANCYSYKRLSGFKVDTTQYDVRFSGRQLIEFSEWFMGYKNELLREYLKEKGERLKQKSYKQENCWYVPIKNISTEFYQGEVFNMEVKGEHTYVVEDIAVHNCAIYQIDPQEIGIGMKEEGSAGNGLSGDNTQEKIDLSRDKGLYPLLRFVENFINVNIIDLIDEDFFLEFVGLREESMREALERQKSEAEFKKTINEIRAEDGLPPLPGCDDIILNPTYLSWYQQFSPKAQKKQEQQAAMNPPPFGGPGAGAEGGNPFGGGDESGDGEAEGEGQDFGDDGPPPPVQENAYNQLTQGNSPITKSRPLRVEWYKVD